MAATGSDGRLVGGLASAGAVLSPVTVVALASPAAGVALEPTAAALSPEVTTPAGTLEAPPLSSFDEQLTARRRAPARAKRGAMRMRGSTLPTARPSVPAGRAPRGTPR